MTILNTEDHSYWNTGMMEYWNSGMAGSQRIGMIECWNNGFVEIRLRNPLSSSHYSIIPILQHSIICFFP
jgi:hypothetical protein